MKVLIFVARNKSQYKNLTKQIWMCGGILKSNDNFIFVSIQERVASGC